MIGQREDIDPENCPLINDLSFPKARLSQLPRRVCPCVFLHVLCFSNKCFTFLFTFHLLVRIFLSRQARTVMQALASGLHGLAVRTPGLHPGDQGLIPCQGTKVLLPATAHCCCLLQATAHCCVCPKSDSSVTSSSCLSSSFLWASNSTFSPCSTFSIIFTFVSIVTPWHFLTVPATSPLLLRLLPDTLGLK